MQIKKLYFKLIMFLFLTFFSSSCSIKFDEAANAESTTPEFIFQEAKLTRYRNGQQKNTLSANKIEQYKDSTETFAKGVAFQSFDNKNELDTEGECGYLYMDTKSELYELYDDIKVFSHAQNTRFYADSLRWNSKSEQLTGGKNDTVKIEKEDTTIYGSGFAASGVSKTYTFSGSVSGDIETK